MIILYLLLAHLISDFLLQPNKLMYLKRKTWHGTLFHIFLHFVITFVLLLPFMPNSKVILVAALIILSHFFIDLMKIFMEKKTKHYLTLFIADQTLHFAIVGLGGWFLLDSWLMITAGGWFLSDLIVWLYTDFTVVLGLCLMIFVTVFYDLMMFQVGWTSGKDYKPDFVKFLVRILVLLVIYGATVWVLKMFFLL